MFGLMGAAAAEALNKWDGGRVHRGEVGLPPPQFWCPGVLPPGNLWRYRFKSVQLGAFWS